MSDDYFILAFNVGFGLYIRRFSFLCFCCSRDDHLFYVNYPIPSNCIPLTTHAYPSQVMLNGILHVKREVGMFLSQLHVLSPGVSHMGHSMSVSLIGVAYGATSMGLCIFGSSYQVYCQFSPNSTNSTNSDTSTGSKLMRNISSVRPQGSGLGLGLHG